MGSAIRLTSRNAYDKTKMTMATGSKNDAPPMSVVLTNSLKVPFKRTEVIEVKAIESIYHHRVCDRFVPQVQTSHSLNALSLLVARTWRTPQNTSPMSARMRRSILVSANSKNPGVTKQAIKAAMPKLLRHVALSFSLSL